MLTTTTRGPRRIFDDVDGVHLAAWDIMSITPPPLARGFFAHVGFAAEILTSDPSKRGKNLLAHSTGDVLPKKEIFWKILHSSCFPKGKYSRRFYGFFLFVFFHFLLIFCFPHQKGNNSRTFYASPNTSKKGNFLTLFSFLGRLEMRKSQRSTW